MCRHGGAMPALTYPVDVTGLDRLGRRLALELALAEVAGGEDDGESVLTGRHFIFVFRDVSEQRGLEVSRREALQAQVDAERAKANFLATASHELRTPLNHIRGFTALLEAGIGGTLSDRQRDYVGDIGTDAGHLSEIVTDILSYAELAAGEELVAAAEVAAGDLVAQAVRELAGLAKARRVRIRIGGNGLDCPLRVDTAAMGRAMMHVLRNALQFCPVDGAVAVDVRRRPDAVTIAIADHGPGMETAALDRMLDAFGKGEDALVRSHGGLGIGLSLARACLQRHGGRLAIDSRLGKGTTVTFVLPVSEAAAVSSAA
jgi:signal transduction histidine kinase